MHVFDCFPLFMSKSKLLPSLFGHSLSFKERLERFAPVVLYKRTTVSDSLWSLMTKERRERFALFQERIALSLTKTSESLEKQSSQPWNQGQLGGCFEREKNSGLNLVTLFLLSLQSFKCLGSFRGLLVKVRRFVDSNVFS